MTAGRLEDPACGDLPPCQDRLCLKGERCQRRPTMSCFAVLASRKSAHSAALLQLSLGLAYFTRTNPMMQSCCVFRTDSAGYALWKHALSSPATSSSGSPWLLSASFFSAGVPSRRLVLHGGNPLNPRQWVRQRQPIAMLRFLHGRWILHCPPSNKGGAE